MKAIALEQSLRFYCRSVEVLHDGDAIVVNGCVVEAAVEFAESVFFAVLVHIDDAGADDFADASGPLALQVDSGRLGVPVNEVAATRVTRVAHVAEGDASVHRLFRGVVVPFEVEVDEHLEDCENREDTEETNHALLDHKVVLDSDSVAEKDEVISKSLSRFLGTLFFLFLDFRPA